MRATTASAGMPASGSIRSTYLAKIRPMAGWRRRAAVPRARRSRWPWRSHAAGSAAGLPQQVGRRLCRRARPDQRQQGGLALRIVPDLEDQPHDGRTEPVPRHVECRADLVTRRERQVEHGLEELVLAAEVVVHEGRVHPGGPGDRPHGRGVEPAGGELRARRVDDGAAGVGRAGPTTGRPGPGRGGPTRHRGPARLRGHDGWGRPSRPRRPGTTAPLRPGAAGRR